MPFYMYAHKLPPAQFYDELAVRRFYKNFYIFSITQETTAKIALTFTSLLSA